MVLLPIPLRYAYKIVHAARWKYTQIHFLHQEHRFTLQTLQIANPAITTPYILHRIFLHLPQQDLLLIQRVYPTWYEAISSSKVVLVALFLYPERKKSVYANVSFELNPLLQSRFPTFFDIDGEIGAPSPYMHGISPWFHSHWTENIHPWPEYPYDSYGRRSITVKSPKIDPRRAAAYRYPKASWRRMIPCMPPPIELQISFKYHKSKAERIYTLRCLKFSNESTLKKEASILQLHQPWLTFGLLYGIIEAAWFQGIPDPVGQAQFDYSFQATRPYIWKPTLTSSGQRTRAPAEERETIIRYGKREKMRGLLPEKQIGGPGRFLCF